MMSDLLGGLRQLLFPDNCLLCRNFINSKQERRLCPVCAGTLAQNVPPFCGLCSRHLEHYTDDGLCTSCRKGPRHYDQAWAACLYNEPMRDLVHAFKYKGKTGLRHTFAGLMREYIDTYHVPINEFDLVTPVPLHPVRLRERGYNQSALLSEALCRHYGRPHKDLLVRTRPTDTQALLDQKQRWTNVGSAFKMNPSVSVADRSILLVDDLLTTGATAHAAAASLKEAGAAHVGVMVVAITP